MMKKNGVFRNPKGPQVLAPPSGRPEINNRNK